VEIPKAALLWNPPGKRKRGRPKTRWRRSAIKEAGKSWSLGSWQLIKWKEHIDNLYS
jgi:hypothetical protein